MIWSPVEVQVTWIPGRWKILAVLERRRFVVRSLLDEWGSPGLEEREMQRSASCGVPQSHRVSVNPCYPCCTVEGKLLRVVDVNVVPGAVRDPCCAATRRWGRCPGASGSTQEKASCCEVLPGAGGFFLPSHCRCLGLYWVCIQGSGGAPPVQKPRLCLHLALFPHFSLIFLCGCLQRLLGSGHRPVFN